MKKSIVFPLIDLEADPAPLGFPFDDSSPVKRHQHSKTGES